MKFRFLSMLMHSESSQREQQSGRKAERKIANGMMKEKKQMKGIF